MKECTKDECGMRRFGAQESADVGVAMTESRAFVECCKRRNFAALFFYNRSRVQRAVGEVGS